MMYPPARRRSRDSLDAATDNIGRCYNLAKPFRTLLEELRAQSGTRYAPNVVALFEDERFCQQLAEKHGCRAQKGVSAGVSRRK